LIGLTRWEVTAVLELHHPRAHSQLPVSRRINPVRYFPKAPARLRWQRAPQPRTTAAAKSVAANRSLARRCSRQPLLRPAPHWFWSRKSLRQRPHARHRSKKPHAEFVEQTGQGLGRPVDPPPSNRQPRIASGCGRASRTHRTTHGGANHTHSLSIEAGDSPNMASKWASTPAGN